MPEHDADALRLMKRGNVTPEQRINLHRRLAHLVLIWEALWPALVGPLAIIAVFLAFALVDAVNWLNGWVHLAILCVFALAFLASLIAGLRRFRRSTHQQANRRLELASSLEHRPLTALEDELADQSDPLVRALWRRHKARALQQLRRLRAGWPHPGVPARDPYGLRAGALLLLVIGAAVGASDPASRIMTALTPDFSAPTPPEARIEAWLNPPDYTGVVPSRVNRETPQPIKIPAGSTILARLFGGQGDARLLLDEDATAFERLDAQNQQIERKIERGNVLALMQGNSEIARWHYEIVPDQPPTATTGDGPQVTARNALRIEYEAKDDYGVVDVAAVLALAKNDQSDAAAPAGQDSPPAKSAERKELRLALPLLQGKREARDAGFHDLTAHPWAGLPVTLKIVATDGAGQTGTSKTRTFRLPERIFRHPVARAIIEQRRKLAEDSSQADKVARALSAIASAPKTFDEDIVAFLAMRTAAERLLLDRDGEAIEQVQELLWDTALRIEDGGVSLAERELRAAQRDLMDALSRDADDAEIQQLMDRLEEAMQKYLQALAEQAKRLAKQNGEPQPFDQEAQMLTSQDLQKMLDRARDLARMGAKDAAREMLRQLQEMLENLQSGRMQAMSREMQQGQRDMRELGELMDRQQSLLDRTFRQGQQQGQQQGQAGQQQQQGGPGRQQGQGVRGLSEQQEALRRQLGEMMRRMGDASGAIPAPLGRAERAMRRAQKALQQGQSGPAMQNQTQALEQMAEGMREMAEQMSRRMGQGGQMQSMGTQRDVDPMGRPMNGTGVDTSRVQIPEQWELRRARQILRELHRRSGEFSRPSDERLYIERLLRRF
jgi:uncharacterized protein (TIGR02302 family)